MTTKTPAQLRAEAADCDRRAEESFRRCDTDGFLSQWASGITGQLKRRQASLLEAGGTSKFPGLYRRSDGARAKAKLYEAPNRFAPWKGPRLVWMFIGENDKPTGRFIPHSKGTPRSRLYKEGFEIREEDAPAQAKIMGSGRGLSGCASAYVGVVRDDSGYPDDAVVML